SDRSEMIAITHNEVHVWDTSLVVDDEELAYDESLLSPDERRYAARFTNTSARIQFVASRAKLRELLSRYTNEAPHDLRFSMTREGKPFLTSGREFEFNITHSGDLVLFGIGYSRPVGVDMERIKPIPRALELAKRYMAPDEHALVANAPPEERDRTFLSLWVKREGSGKAYGVGIWKVLESSRRDTANQLFAEIMRDYMYRVIDYGSEYIACVAALGADWQIVQLGSVRKAE
ncbi:MAG TPA: 4'-phosphopantetheinyl transferase superfamily protein, partial [Gemmatimonadaceae bacterium]|nr:4'-phosphopantetheinyl transferase superfamily protein [Gemmatimonadaceae bacterium]